MTFHDILSFALLCRHSTLACAHSSHLLISKRIPSMLSNGYALPAQESIVAATLAKENILVANEYCVARIPSYYAKLAATDVPEVCKS